MSSRCSRKALYRPKKWHFQKPQKTFIFCRFLGSRGVPREPQEAQEGSQKVPRELQNLPKKGSKNRPEKSRVLEPFWVRFGGHFGSQKWTKKEPKKGPQKWPQKWSKKGLTGTAKIAPSRAGLGPFPPRSYTPNRTCTLKKVVNVKPPRYLKVSLSAIYITSIQEPTTIFFQETLLKLRFPFGFRSLLEP